jgi:hypothetical protein
MHRHFNLGSQLFFLCLTLIGCGDLLKKEEKESSLPDAVYTVTGPFCTADDAKPQYTGATTVALRKQESFGDLTGAIQTVTLSGKTITKVWARHDTTANAVGQQFNCEIHWTGSVATNKEVEKTEKDREFQESPLRRITWAPEECKLEVHSTNSTPGDGITDNGMYTSSTLTQFFKTTTSGTTPETLWKVTHDGNIYRLTMSDADAAGQSGYTCPSGLKLYYLWTKS